MATELAGSNPVERCVDAAGAVSAGVAVDSSPQGHDANREDAGRFVDAHPRCAVCRATLALPSRRRSNCAPTRVRALPTPAQGASRPPEGRMSGAGEAIEVAAPNAAPPSCPPER
jgi:hypothetical protein